MRIKVYAGVSVSAKEAKAILPGAVFSGPIRNGQIRADIVAGYQVLAIIDGADERSQAASATEIMDAIRSGLKIYGSSGLGAIRAVELAPFGMIGHGKIFETLRAEQIGGRLTSEKNFLRSCRADGISLLKTIKQDIEELQALNRRLQPKSKDLQHIRKISSQRGT